MAPHEWEPASFATQTNALVRKNLTFQKRNWKSNAFVAILPILLCIVLALTQHWIDSLFRGDPAFVPMLHPPSLPPLLQVPPEIPCSGNGPCSFPVLFTGGNRPFAEGLARNLFTNGSFSNSSSDFLSSLSDFVLGTKEPILGPFQGTPQYVILSQCLPGLSLEVPIRMGNITLAVNCSRGLPLWRGSSSMINDELFKGYQRADKEVLSAYDLLDSNDKMFNVTIWYNSTFDNDTQTHSLLRVPRAVNMVSRAYLQLLKGSSVKLQFEYLKEMPRLIEQQNPIDLSSLLVTLFFVWIVELPLPILLTNLVYEKQQKLRIMMRMHGLGDGPYWTITYAYFFLLSSVYMLCFVIFGSVIGLKFSKLNDYGIQFVFYFIYINLQIVLAFLAATCFSSVKTATVTGYIYVFTFGLLGEFLFKYFIEDTSFSRGWVLIMEIIPGFSLYRGMYELSQYSIMGKMTGTSGMQWTDLNDSENKMKEVMIIMVVEWMVLLPVVYYLDQLASVGDGNKRATLFSLPCFKLKRSIPSQNSPPEQGSEVLLEFEKHDVSQERKVVEQLLLEPNPNYAVISDNLKKVYPGMDGNPEKLAVHGLSLALPRGECFGMLGPNGAGKTSFISMMIGLTRPTSGTAFIKGMDIRTHMNKVYTGIGVCPQHDLLWETLTGKEHLMFYGRLKNLKGAALEQAVEESMKNVNLFHGGVGDKQIGKYSGGMKRRLSVAISLIGDPQVVYMDEPSTGLDPASRKFLWNVVKRAKQNRAIILTTHSMEEAEVLCDRLGIFVDGSLQCIGNATELKARYGGTLVLTMTTPPNEEKEVEILARQLSPRAKKIYHTLSTQKFELPKQEVKITDVLRAIDGAKAKFTVHAWGLAETTLEDVFIKVAKEAHSSFS